MGCKQDGLLVISNIRSIFKLKLLRVECDMRRLEKGLCGIFEDSIPMNKMFLEFLKSFFYPFFFLMFINNG